MTDGPDSIRARSGSERQPPGSVGARSGSEGVDHPAERTLLSLRPHPVTILLRSLPAILILLAYVLIIKAYTIRASGVRVADLIQWLAVGVVALRIAWEIARWLGRRYVLTERRLWAWDGVLRRWRVEITLDRVQNVVLHKSLPERVLGLGTIGVSSAAGGPGLEVLWISIARPEAALSAITQARDARTPAPARVESDTAPPAPVASPPAPRRPLVIGLVGGIGSGKSAVSDILRDLGAVVSDSDTQAKSMLARDDVKSALVQWWGTRVLTPHDAIDRRAVASIIFADPQERRRLESLIHPLLRAGREALKRQAQADDAPMVVIDAPLLFEAGVDLECDEVWFVDAPRTQRLARVSASRAWTADELDRREAAQMPLEEKRRRATRVITNDTDVTTLRARVTDMAREALRRAGATSPRRP